MKELERENRELRRANEILRKASAYFAQAETDAGVLDFANGADRRKKGPFEAREPRVMTKPRWDLMLERPYAMPWRKARPRSSPQ